MSRRTRRFRQNGRAFVLKKATRPPDFHSLVIGEQLGPMGVREVGGSCLVGEEGNYKASACYGWVCSRIWVTRAPARARAGGGPAEKTLLNSKL